MGVRVLASLALAAACALAPAAARALLGIFPAWQTLGAQALVLAVVAGSLLLVRRRARVPRPIV